MEGFRANGSQCSSSVESAKPSHDSGLVGGTGHVMSMVHSQACGVAKRYAFVLSRVMQCMLCCASFSRSGGSSDYFRDGAFARPRCHRERCRGHAGAASAFFTGAVRPATHRLGRYSLAAALSKTDSAMCRVFSRCLFWPTPTWWAWGRKSEGRWQFLIVS